MLKNVFLSLCVCVREGSRQVGRFSLCSGGPRGIPPTVCSMEFYKRVLISFSKL